MAKQRIKIRHAAVALSYQPDRDDAARVVAKGSGLVAEKIIELAVKINVPVRRDADLVEVLSKLDLDDEIPEDVYLVVAEILSYVYTTSQRHKLRQFGISSDR
ncbi:MAG: EscU/YscU/HrcU family type III secretion system export apparatus switch protein [Planctomycetes bacterium]|nr:EscU/YscU/HrcU family type III secretion system export apparatus switch protein [Planctomycetota bacterium]